MPATMRNARCIAAIHIVVAVGLNTGSIYTMIRESKLASYIIKSINYRD